MDSVLGGIDKMLRFWTHFLRKWSPGAWSLPRTGLLLALLVSNACFSGCSIVRNEIGTCSGPWSKELLAIRNRSFSAKAWLRRKHHFGKEKFNRDFRAGFRAGYEEVASGGNGCCPAVPPQKYWSWEFQLAEGRGRTSAWYAGFPHGARTAEEDGVANWNQMPMSLGLEAEYDKAGMPMQQESIYPIPDANTMGIPDSGVPVESIPTDRTIIPLPPQSLPAVPSGGQIVP